MRSGSRQQETVAQALPKSLADPNFLRVKLLVHRLLFGFAAPAAWPDVHWASRSSTSTPGYAACRPAPAADLDCAHRCCASGRPPTSGRGRPRYRARSKSGDNGGKAGCSCDDFGVAALAEQAEGPGINEREVLTHVVVLVWVEGWCQAAQQASG